MGLFDKLFGSNNTSPSFRPSTELMPEEQFWNIMHTSFRRAKGNFEQQQDELSKALGRLPLQDLIHFDNRFSQLHGLAFNWELWGAIYIINGGCSDDSFIDFRDWLIAQGKDVFYRTLENPASLTEMETDRISADWEGMGYIASDIFKERTGEDIPSEFAGNQDMTGQAWNEDNEDLKNMFPALWTKYVENGSH